MTTIVLTIPIPKLVSSNARIHWREVAKRVQWLRSVALCAAMAEHGSKPPLGRCHLTVHIAAPTARRRDAANLHPTVKACLDGIVQAGVIVDDSDAHLVGPDLRPDPERSERGAYRLTFAFAEAALIARHGGGQ